VAAVEEVEDIMVVEEEMVKIQGHLVVLVEVEDLVFLVHR
jgi:hypothetical protein